MKTKMRGSIKTINSIIVIVAFLVGQMVSMPAGAVAEVPIDMSINTPQPEVAVDQAQMGGEDTGRAEIPKQALMDSSPISKSKKEIEIPPLPAEKEELGKLGEVLQFKNLTVTIHDKTRHYNLSGIGPGEATLTFVSQPSCPKGLPCPAAPAVLGVVKVRVVNETVGDRAIREINLRRGVQEVEIGVGNVVRINAPFSVDFGQPSHSPIDFFRGWRLVRAREVPDGIQPPQPPPARERKIVDSEAIRTGRAEVVVTATVKGLQSGDRVFVNLKGSLPIPGRGAPSLFKEMTCQRETCKVHFVGVPPFYNLYEIRVFSGNKLVDSASGEIEIKPPLPRSQDGRPQLGSPLGWSTARLLRSKEEKEII